MSRRKKRSGHFWQKALSSLLCMTMIYTIPGVGKEVLANTADSPSTDPSTYVMDATSDGMLDTKINPHLLIQHYYYYPYQELGDAVEDFGGKEDYYDQAKFGASKDEEGSLRYFLYWNKVAWNTNARANQHSSLRPTHPTNSEWRDFTKNLRPDNSPTTGAGSFDKAREEDPKFLLDLLTQEDIAAREEENRQKEEQGQEGEPVGEVGEVETTNLLYRLFKDDSIRYFDKPQMRYMNKLFNTLDSGNNNDEVEYNDNYTLTQLWLTVDKNLSSNSSNESVKFRIFYRKWKKYKVIVK